jgi:hypothetical protein
MRDERGGRYRRVREEIYSVKVVRGMGGARDGGCTFGVQEMTEVSVAVFITGWYNSVRNGNRGRATWTAQQTIKMTHQFSYLPWTALLL